MDRIISPECCVSILVLFIGICIPLTYIADTWYYDGNLLTQRHNKLLIGILSARDHFENRQVLRSTWIQDIYNQNEISEHIEYKFVVGSKGCNIDVKQRKSLYSCSRLNYSLPKMFPGRDEFPFFIHVPTETESDQNAIDNLKIVFNSSLTIRYPVVIKKLGLHLSVKLKQTPIAVQLYDINMEQIILSARFNTIDSGIIVHDLDVDVSQYRFQSVNHVLFPKDFEGLLVVTSNEKIELDPNFLNVSCKTNSGGTVEFVPHDESGYPVHAEFVNNLFVPNMIGSIHEYDTFNMFIKESDQLDLNHMQTEEAVDVKLSVEAATYDDILLVDVVDVYRNLPLKLLLFHKWIHSEKHVQFVMKTDDDCYLNVPGIMNGLNNLKSNSDKIWWGHFRENWYVEKTGKWAETAYRSSEYPAFACGSGNIVSHDISDWLAYNSDQLFAYQGEDTSMGIWLSALGPDYVNDVNWLCDKHCHDNVLTIPQLSIDEIKQHWNNKQNYGKVCD